MIVLRDHYSRSWCPEYSLQIRLRKISLLNLSHRCACSRQNLSLNLLLLLVFLILLTRRPPPPPLRSLPLLHRHHPALMCFLLLKSSHRGCLFQARGSEKEYSLLKFKTPLLTQLLSWVSVSETGHSTFRFWFIVCVALRRVGEEEHRIKRDDA